MSKHKTLTLFGILCILIPLGLYALWIYAINQVDDHMESVALYKDYLSPILQGRYDASYAGLAFAALGCGALFSSLHVKGVVWKILNILFLIIGCLLFILYTFSLM